MAKAIVRGDKEIIANMRNAYNSVGGKALDQNLMTSLKPMRDQTEVNARAHRQPHVPKGGHLDEGVVIAKRESRGSMFRVFWISFRKRARFIAHLVEYGTAPHAQPNRGIIHPGARPFPFFRPAFEATKNEVVDAVGRNAWARIKGSIKGVYGK